MKNEGELYFGILVNANSGAGGRGSFQVGAAGNMRFGCGGLSFCRLEECKKREAVMHDS